MRTPPAGGPPEEDHLQGIPLRRGARIRGVPEILLLANAAAVLALTGLIWFVHVVHYPLFAAVGDSAWSAYHRAHTRRTTWVVAGPMGVDLLTSLALVFLRPDGVGPAAAVAGAALAIVTWAATGLAAVPAHDRLTLGWDPRALEWLLRADAVRTAAWTAHAALVLGMLAATR